MAAHSRTPWCGTVTLTTSSTAYQLSALVLAATNPPLTPGTPAPLKAQFLSLQLDVGAGGARLHIGNEDVSATNRGVELVAGQITSAGLTLSANLINLADIWLLSDTSAVKVNVTFITR